MQYPIRIFSAIRGPDSDAIEGVRIKMYTTGMIRFYFFKDYIPGIIMYSYTDEDYDRAVELIKGEVITNSCNSVSMHYISHIKDALSALSILGANSKYFREAVKLYDKLQEVWKYVV